MRLYIYPDAPPQDPGTPLFQDVLPLSPQGIARHCQVVKDPAEAEYFYGGQFHDKNSALLVLERFEFFKGNENKHIFDVEGDWDEKEIPQWLEHSIITARNALVTRHSHWKRVFATPGCSMLMLKILEAGDIPYQRPSRHGFQFRGQLDWRKTRLAVAEGVQMAGLPGEIQFMPTWNLMNEEENHTYVDLLNTWSFALCPRAWGHFTMRFYEACAYGRYPIVVGDNIWLGHQEAVFYKIYPMPVDPIRYGKSLKGLFDSMDIENAVAAGLRAKEYFDSIVRPYYKDPTKAFLDWLEKS